MIYVSLNVGFYAPCWERAGAYLSRRGCGGWGTQREKPAVSRRVGPRSSRHEGSRGGARGCYYNYDAGELTCHGFPKVISCIRRSDKPFAHDATCELNFG